MDLPQQPLQILIATHNRHKVEELRAILDSSKYQIKALFDIGFDEEIIEDGKTFAENALIKARIFKASGWDIILGEDSGLEVDALQKRPGIYTARFAGPQRDPVANMEKVLNLLAGKFNRRARFITVIAMIYRENEYIIEGTVEGKISHSMKGKSGFGYDPIFIPNGYSETFAELGEEIKNKLSHRYQAVTKLAIQLEQLAGTKP